MAAFGLLLRQAREKAGLSRERLAQRVGLDASYIYRVETGERRPSRESALALVDALGLGDETMNQWLAAAGYEPVPILSALRAAVRTRGTVRRSAGGPACSPAGDAGAWARRLETIGLREAAIERLLEAMAAASLAEQEEAARAISGTFSRVAEALQSPVRTAVIPAAGGHHRLLAPHVMQHLLLGAIREAAQSGISSVVLILAPGSEEPLYRPIREALSVAVAPALRVQHVQQSRPEGLGDAVLQAKELVGGAPFAVLLPDDVVRARGARTVHRDLRRMIDLFRRLENAHLVAVTSILKSKMRHCGVARLGAAEIHPRVFPILQLVEKPGPANPVCAAKNIFGIVGRYLLQPNIFAVLNELRKERRRVELTEALERLRSAGTRVCAYELEATRTDVGEVVEQAGGLIGDS